MAKWCVDLGRSQSRIILGRDDHKISRHCRQVLRTFKQPVVPEVFRSIRILAKYNLNPISRRPAQCLTSRAEKAGFCVFASVCCLQRRRLVPRCLARMNAPSTTKLNDECYWMDGHQADGSGPCAVFQAPSYPKAKPPRAATSISSMCSGSRGTRGSLAH